VFTGQTGLPVNVTDSSSSYPADRPNVVPGVPRYLPNYRSFPSTHQYINPAAFTLPDYTPGAPTTTAFGAISGAQLVGGNLQRYSLNAPGLEQLDASIIKNFVVRDNVHFLLRLDSFNALNHTNLTGLNTSFSTNVITNPSSTTFGQASGDSTPRTVQIGARITF
jgi:hypothetical protein